MVGSSVGAVTARCRTEPDDPDLATDLAAGRPTSGSAERSVLHTRILMHWTAFSLVTSRDAAMLLQRLSTL